MDSLSNSTATATATAIAHPPGSPAQEPTSLSSAPSLEVEAMNDATAIAPGHPMGNGYDMGGGQLHNPPPQSQQQQQQHHHQHQHQLPLRASHDHAHAPNSSFGNANLADLPPPVLRPSSPSGSSVASFAARAPSRRSNGSVTGGSAVSGPSNGHHSNSAGGRGRHPDQGVEEVLLLHYTTLKRFLGIPYNVEVSSSKREATRSSRARDKLLRLSAAQVCELSQDVYDELLRRQALAGGPRGIPPANPNVPPSLPPRPEFHDKRNQARQKLSSLQYQRFKDLAADVLCELERRFPYFSSVDVPGRNRRQSPALSAVSGYSNARSSNGSTPFPPRSTSRARAPSNLRLGQQQQFQQQQGTVSPGPFTPGFSMQSPTSARSVTRTSNPPDARGSHQMSPHGLGGMHSDTASSQSSQPPPTIDENAPLAKSSQSNTIVPVKSTLVEESDSGGEEDEEAQHAGEKNHHYDSDRHEESSFALEKTLHKAQIRQSEQVLDSKQSERIAELEKQIEELRNELVTRDEDQKHWEEERKNHKDTSEKLTEAEASYQALEVELNAMKQIHEEQKQQLEQVNEFENQRKEWEETRAELEHQILEVQERNKELFDDIERIQADHEYNIERNATEFEQEKRIWEEEKDILQVKLIQAQAQNDGIQEQINMLELQHKEKLKQHEEKHDGDSAKEAEEWEQLAKSLQAKLAESESQRLEATEQLDTLRNDYEAHLNEQEELHAHALQADKEQWNEVLSELEQKLADTEALTQGLKVECQEWKDKHHSAQEEHVVQMREVEKSMEALNASGGAGGDAGDWKKRYELLEHEYLELQTEFKHCLEAEAELRQQLEEKKQNETTGEADPELKLRYESLQKEHLALKKELKEQQEVTEQVRQQAQTFLAEMREISEEGGNLEREESLNKEIERLGEEVQIWKDRYAKTRTRLRGLRSSTLGLPGMEYNIHLFKENDLLNSDGMVKDVHVTKFQMAIDELLRSARMGEPQIVIDKVKTVVTAVRGLNQDLERANSHLSAREQGTLSPPPASSSNLPGLSAPVRKLKTRVASTANNLITATKNYSRSNGLSPVSLLDAAASHLCAAVVELVRTVKIRPTPIDELAEDEDERAVQSPDMFSVAHSQITAGRFSAGEGESMLSDFGTPERGSNMGTMGDMAADVSRLLTEHRDAEVEKERSGEQAKNLQRDSMQSAGRLSSGDYTNTRSRPPSMTPNGEASAQSQRKYSQTGMSNPPPRMQSLKIDEQDEELEDLRIYIDDQTMNLLKSVEAIVSDVRASVQNPTAHTSNNKSRLSAMREPLDTITAIIEHVSIATDQILTTHTASPTNMKLRQELHGQVTPIIEQLAQEREDLIYLAEKLPSNGNNAQYNAGIEQVAYSLGRDMKLLVSWLDPQSHDGKDGAVSQSNQAADHSDGAGSVYDEDEFSDYEGGEVASVASVAIAHVGHGTPVRARSSSKQGP
ncbi:assembly factor cbp4 [Ascosphaera pollenicola]|nr:assembly factor cbp4 [Ascosphaera pollenicola]